jgi:hypothetical protein
MLLCVGLVTGCGSSSSNNAAATVNGHDISMADYTAAFHVQRAEAASSAGYDVCSVKDLATPCNILKQQSLEGLIQAELIREYAAKHGISLTQAEIQANWAVVFKARFDSRQDVLRAWLRHIGESEQQLRDSLKADLLRQKVMYSVTSVPATVPGVRIAHLIAASSDELKLVQGLLQRRTAFGQIVRYLDQNSKSGCGEANQQQQQQQASQQQSSVGGISGQPTNPDFGSTAIGCGDLGWVPDALLPTKYAQLRTAPVGNVVGPLRTVVVGNPEYDFFLVELRDRHYPLTGAQSAFLHVKLFNAWLQQQEARAQVTRYIQV